MQFDHVGIVTNEKKPGAVYVEATKVWVTNIDDHPFRVEWLYFEPDSPVKGNVRNGPHVAFRVESVDAIQRLSKGMKVVLEPFDAGFCVAGFYETPDGAVIELVSYKEGASPWS